MSMLCFYYKHPKKRAHLQFRRYLIGGKKQAYECCWNQNHGRFILKRRYRNTA